MMQKEAVPVIVQADQNVQSGLLIRVIDEAKLAGAEKVSIATRKKQG
jgi:biopolymer transport protein ExbD